MEEDAGKLTHMGGATGRIQGADYSLVDYNRAGVPLVEIVTKPIAGRRRAGARTGQGLRRRRPGDRQEPRHLGRPDGTRQRPLRRQRLADARRAQRVRHPLRDEERELPARRRTRRPLRDPAPRRRPGLRRDGHPGDPPLARGHPHHHLGPAEVGCRRLPLLPGAGPGADRHHPRMDRGTARHAARAAGRAPQAPEGRLGLLGRWSSATSSTPACMDEIEETIAAGATAAVARKWWMGEIVRRAKNAEVDPAELGVTPATSWSWSAGARPARSTTRWPAEVLDGVLAGEGTPAEVVEKRGLAVVSDDGPLWKPSTRPWPRSPAWRTRSAAASSRPSAPSSAAS